MKISKKISRILTLVIAFYLVLLYGCSKERTETKNEVNEYEPMNDYFDSRKQEEQVYEINSDGDGPLIGNQGTKIWGSKDILMYPNGDSVQYPFTIKLIELYTPKDMIYYQMPTVSADMLLTTGGEIRVRAFKDDQELVLRPDATWTVEMPNNSPLVGMKIYYGIDNTSYVDWTDIPAGNFNTTSYGYTGEIEQLGWIACGKAAYQDVSTTNYTFTSSADNLQNVSIFIYLPQLKGLMQVYNQTSDPLPLDENMKIVAMGIDGNNQLFSFYKDTLVSTYNIIAVKLDSISDADLTTLLDEL